jgi:lipopolysaccharide/colanic/teichoic acid biosynthesis glycosyltransferase
VPTLTPSRRLGSESTAPAPGFARMEELVLGLPGTWSRPLPLPDTRAARQAAAAAARRALNVAAALLVLVLALPLMVVIAVLVKLTSPGPVLYRQTRVGLDRRAPGSGGHWRREVDYGGRLFTIYKFRTMTAPPGASRLQVWAQPDDPRVTPLGRVLRRYRLDELPQMWNVLRGDMNVVGPRPEQPRIFDDLRGQVDRYAERQRVLPGITGWAQVNQAYDRCVDDVRRKVQMDLEYIERQGVLTDLRIMLLTAPSVLRRGGW